jgi:hypothetical protein
MAESEDLGVTGVASGEQPSQSRQHESTKHTEQRHEGTLRGAGPARERPGTLGGRVLGTLRTSAAHNANDRPCQRSAGSARWRP